MVIRRSYSRPQCARAFRGKPALLACFWAAALALSSAGWAQDDDGDAGGNAGGATTTSPSNPGTGTGTAPSTGNTAPPAGVPNPGSGNTVIPPPNGGSTDVFAPAPVSGNLGPALETPATTTPNTPPDATTAIAPPTEAPVTVNGAYGSAPIVLQPGAGRFAQKPLKFSLSTAIGYDDNVFSASEARPASEQVVVEATPDTKVTIPGKPAVPPRFVGGILIPGTPAVPAREVTIPGTPAQTVEVPGTEGPLGSFTTNGSVQATLNIARPRTLFSLQLSFGTQYFWSRPGKKNDYNGSINLVLSHRVTPRLRANITLSSVYQNTPDFSRTNIATRNAQGPYYDTNFRLDLEYQWAARFSTITSYSFNGTYFESEAQQSQNVTQNIIGNDFRFTLSPRTTLVASLRASADSHEDQAADTTGQFFLGGLDFSLSSRLSTTVRAGLQVQNYTQGNAKSTASPYAEATVGYRYIKGSTISWTNRYGLEPTGLSTQEVTSYITGLAVNHVVSARTSVNVGLNLTHRATDYGNTGQTALSENYVSASLGVNYIFTANWSFNARYDYFKLISNAEASEYGRNRFSIGAAYDF